MFTYERTQKSTLIERFSEAPKHLIIVTGPRQSGKTTVVQQALVEGGRPYFYVPVDQPDIDWGAPFPSIDAGGAIVRPEETAVPRGKQPDSEWLIRIWQWARDEADRSQKGFILALDEIQKIPAWPETVKGLWDMDRIEGRRMHVVLLGSAPLLMQQGLTESLAGRFETIRLSHWSYGEMAAAFDFDLEKFIFFGGYPGAAPLVSEQERWREYILGSLVQTTIERDVLALQRVDKPFLMKRLFELGSAYSGRELSYNKMLGPLQDAGNTTTLARYLDLMSRVGLITGLPKYAAQPARRVSTPKLMVFNTGLMSANSDYTFEQARADRTFWGRLVESAVGAHLLNSHKSPDQLYYWRDGQNEVDFVLARAERLIAIEVKSGSRRSVSRGFHEFEKRFANNVRSIRRIAIAAGEDSTQLAEFLATPVMEWIET